MRFRKKPVVIEAWRWTADGFEYPAWLQQSLDTFCVTRDGDGLLINTLEGTMTARVGDWIIRGVAGELYPCRDDIFQATYEPVEDLTEQSLERTLRKIRAEMAAK